MKDCNRLRLLDILVRPMQRLTKYSLLLKAILKKTDDGLTRNNLILMVRVVDKVGESLTMGDEKQKGVRCQPRKTLEMFQKDLEKTFLEGASFCGRICRVKSSATNWKSSP